MGKATTLSLAGLGTAIVSVGGGAHLLRNRGSKKIPTRNFRVDPPAAHLPFRNLIEFKRHTEGGGSCVTRYFDLLDFQSPGSAMAPDETVTADYFSGGTGDEGSCLIINWEKNIPPGTKLNEPLGNFRWLWTFIKGDKGFIMFAAVKKSKSNAQKVDVEGGLYLVEKESYGWVIRKHKEILDGVKKVRLSNIENLIPADGKNLSLADDSFYKATWRFLEKQPEVDHFCNLDTCVHGADQQFRASWSWRPRADKEMKLTEWSSNIDKWWIKLYPNKEAALLKYLKGFTGEWVIESWSRINF